MRIDKTNTIFLLGGHDLEMQEISNLLISAHYKFIDLQLNWENARLSQYAQHFNDKNLFVGIELVSDIQHPKHYLPVDHHNENSQRRSSIEQVAELIGIELNREQQLIAANDKGYIPALKAMGATDMEVVDIRKRDRAAQGVTEEDERLAEKSIRENLIKINDISIVKSYSQKFSAITDRLYPTNKLIIHTNSELTYYGAGASILAKTFDIMIKNKMAYTGGGINGFFGITKDALDQDINIHSIINQIIQIISYGKRTV